MFHRSHLSIPRTSNRGNTTRNNETRDPFGRGGGINNNSHNLNEPLGTMDEEEQYHQTDTNDNDMDNTLTVSNMFHVGLQGLTKDAKSNYDRTNNNDGFHAVSNKKHFGQPYAVMNLLAQLQEHDPETTIRSSKGKIEYYEPSQIPTNKNEFEKQFEMTESTLKIKGKYEPSFHIAFTIVTNCKNFYTEVKDPAMQFLGSNNLFLNKSRIGKARKMITVGILTKVHPKHAHRDSIATKLTDLIYQHCIKEEDKAMFDPLPDGTPTPFIECSATTIKIEKGKDKIQTKAISIQVPEQLKNILLDALVQMNMDNLLPDNMDFVPFNLVREHPNLYWHAIDEHAKTVDNKTTLRVIGLSEDYLDEEFELHGNNTTARQLFADAGLNLQSINDPENPSIYRMIFDTSKMQENKTKAEQLCREIAINHRMRTGDESAASIIRLTNHSNSKTSGKVAEYFMYAAQKYANPQDDETNDPINPVIIHTRNTDRTYANVTAGKPSAIANRTTTNPATISEQTETMIDEKIDAKFKALQDNIKNDITNLKTHFEIQTSAINQQISTLLASLDAFIRHSTNNQSAASSPMRKMARKESTHKESGEMETENETSNLSPQFENIYTQHEHNAQDDTEMETATKPGSAQSQGGNSSAHQGAT